jgi:hypothetical protein
LGQTKRGNFSTWPLFGLSNGEFATVYHAMIYGVSSHACRDLAWRLHFVTSIPQPTRRQPMSQPIRSAKPQTEEIPIEIADLAAAVSELPAEYREQIGSVVARVIESTKRRRRILNLVQDALGQLRLDMKYLVFDLEATRRERDQLRQQMEAEGTSGEEGFPPTE